MSLVPGPRDRLLGGVEEGLEAGEELLQLLEDPQAPGSPVELTGQRQGLFDQGLEDAYVLEDVGLSEVEEVAE